MDEAYDFIVTGAGSAGCAVAGRLSEDGQHRVLLLEAGPRDIYPWIHIPLGYHKTFNNPRVNWMFDSEPEPELNDRILYQPRGKVLGGTSSINGMVYMRGNAADYDEWRQRGCEGWDYESVLPYFKRAEDNVRGADAFHGTGGPLKVSDHRWQPTLARAMHDAAVQAGIPANPDFNGARQEGVGYYQTTIDKARRWSSARAYLGNARRRRNLTIATGAHATRILIEKGRAVGVEYRTLAGLVRATARREVIVSGGVYGSPQLLMLSGLGPAEHLRRHGIAVVRDMPGVGSHLHDHFNTYVAYRCAEPVTMNDLAISLRHRLKAVLQYAFGQTGPLASMGLFVGALVRSDKRLERPDLQINMFAWAVKERNRNGVVPQPFSAFGLSPVHLRPDGRGTVRLRSPDPLAAPEIRFNFLKSAYDFQALIEGMRICREIARQPALRPFVVEEILPGPHVVGEADLRADIRARGVSNLHPVGTCRMGREVDAVVDPQLRLLGIAGLRVADASIMPTIVAGNTNAPSIMIGEKCADMVRAAAR
ncbi:GMC family oxidoreductase N-terminal domain-containing protein [Enhydrobacter sp.]|jgi:choline dehydrogenase|uniref:GMC family oxidoreductase n=1 Tax=Enhydrobacter sp. TaxID=1894999 RepID=UPI00260BFC7F|nr:GMC family oxidoreductase N-terminal domain-containing protein [Enhydrobacter sp.]WIM14299.1 MAG: Oxidoreductase, GMC family [Enhydrobacter sp.]